MQHRRDVLSGILNGMDPAEWNPATDPHIAAKYDADTVARGKPALQGGPAKGAWPAPARRRPAGWPHRPPDRAEGHRPDRRSPPALGADRRRAMGHLGHGPAEVPSPLREPRRSAMRDRIALRQEFSNPLAHRIEAGADLFLMPSRFEPCGLNQLYSLKYGTMPLVRATGGLADTITGFGAANARRSAAQRLFLRGVQPAGLERDVAGGLRRLPSAGHLAATDRDRDAAGLVVGGQREAVRRSLSEDDASPRAVGDGLGRWIAGCARKPRD